MKIPAKPGQRGRDWPLFGLRRRPGRLALALFRLPLNAYRHDAGRLMGRTFLQFTHVGRKTGQPHDAVAMAMVLRYDEASRKAVICAAWGPAADGVRNLRAGPARKCSSAWSRSRPGTGSWARTRRSMLQSACLSVGVVARALVTLRSAGRRCGAAPR